MNTENTNTTIIIQGASETVDIGIYHPAFPTVIISCGLDDSGQAQLILTPSSVVCY